MLNLKQDSRVKIDLNKQTSFERSIVFGRILGQYCKSELWDYFSQFGKILNLHVEYNSTLEDFLGLGFLTVGDHITFDNILTQTHHFKGNEISVDFAQTEDNQKNLPVSNLRVKICNIPNRMSKGQFNEIIQKMVLGIENIYFGTKPLSLASSGCCQLLFKTENDMNEFLAKETLTIDYEGQQVLLMMSKIIDKSMEISETLINLQQKQICKIDRKTLPITCQPPKFDKVRNIDVAGQD